MLWNPLSIESLLSFKYWTSSVWYTKKLGRDYYGPNIHNFFALCWSIWYLSINVLYVTFNSSFFLSFQNNNIKSIKEIRWHFIYFIYICSVYQSKCWWMIISGFWGFSATSNFVSSVSSYFCSSNPLSLSVTTTPPFAIEVDKNPFFH